MRAIFTLLTAAAVAISAGHALAAGNPEVVEIPQKEGSRLKAMLFRPEGQGPFPAVVALHNCTGLNNAAGTLGARYRDWGERLARNGYVVLMPDSHGSRGVGSQCATRWRSIRNDRERVAHPHPAPVWLQSPSCVPPDRAPL